MTPTFAPLPFQIIDKRPLYQKSWNQQSEICLLLSFCRIFWGSMGFATLVSIKLPYLINRRYEFSVRILEIRRETSRNLQQYTT